MAKYEYDFPILYSSHICTIISWLSSNVKYKLVIFIRTKLIHNFMILTLPEIISAITNLCAISNLLQICTNFERF